MCTLSFSAVRKQDYRHFSKLTERGYFQSKAVIDAT
jgi:hypothetical protein